MSGLRRLQGRSWTRLAAAAAGFRVDVSLGALDAVVAMAAYLGILILRFDGEVSAVFWDRARSFLPLAALAHVLLNWTWQLYGQMWRHASVVEARRVLAAGASTLGVLLVAALVAPQWFRLPISVIVLGAAVTTMLGGALRFHARLFAFQRGEAVSGGLRIGVVGAGAPAAALVRQMLADPAGGLHPVAVFDEDRRTHRLSIASVPVAGGVEDIPTAAERLSIHQLVLAMPEADGALVRQVAELADRGGMTLKVMPALPDLLSTPSVRALRDVRIEDLLGRSQVAIDLDDVTLLVRDRTVLITGAGGSIGSEIARQVAALGPHLLVMLDHDETHLHDASTPLAVEPELVLADIRDTAHIDEIIETYRPDVVFHAAAHKHVPLLERNPSQATTTNVIGTRNIVDAAARHGVRRLVFISTDKAVAPSSVMGATKWLGEQLVLQTAPADAAWCAVRFGNVLGSRGSVIPTFARQIESGGPVTVTDPRMTRFFMSVTEAVRLVLQAAAIADGGEVFMLEMGEPVNILELAERMIRLSGRNVGADVPITFVGRRDGEKLQEELRSPTEEVSATAHPFIFAVRPDLIPADELWSALYRLSCLASDRQDRRVAELLFGLSKGEPPQRTVIDLRDPAFIGQPGGDGGA